MRDCEETGVALCSAYFGFNLGRNNIYPELFCGSAKSLEIKSGMVFRLGHNPYLLKTLQFTSRPSMDTAQYIICFSLGTPCTFGIFILTSRWNYNRILLHDIRTFIFLFCHVLFKDKIIVKQMTFC
jgi:hypothetical protein